ncbi:MAG: bifunctional enoyl-CoA hydratase/phosphate acetyltransferase [Azoarcus sp.]|jgi:phosphate acetyltransferase|nr:bifunctional enoyl-CoA hydratase/phosphate acetyltransferase [Azoarcus sp.]
MNHSGDSFIQNRTFDEIEVGDSAQLTRTLRTADIQLFAAISGDINPTHLDPEFAQSGQFRDIVGHSLWGGTLVSAILGTEFPGPGTVYVSQNFNFWRPVTVGDTLTISVTCSEKHEHNHHLVFACKAVNQSGVKVMDGSAEVAAPTQRIRRPKVLPPEIKIADREERFRRLLSLTDGLPPIRIAVASPCDAESLRGPLQAAVTGLVTPLLVGPDRRIRAVAEEQMLDLNGIRIINVPDDRAAAEASVALCRDEGVGALMKGSLSTRELMRAVLSKSAGLRGARRISHVSIASVPAYPKLLLVTDAAINIAPTLEEKADIVQNAIDLARIMGVVDPRVALLAATEAINPKMPATQDAAALCDMAARGRIQGGLLAGPLSFDKAVSPRAANIKDIRSPVAGNADILVAPDIEAANITIGQLEYLADALMAGIVLGARVPIVLTTRADTAQTRTVSCAIAQLIHHHNSKETRPT